MALSVPAALTPIFVGGWFLMWQLGTGIRSGPGSAGAAVGPDGLKGFSSLRDSMGQPVTDPAAQTGTGSCYTQIILP